MDILSNHSIKNRPVFLAGGGFKHSRHMAFVPQFYTSQPQRCTAAETLTGLETASWQEAGNQDQFRMSTWTQPVFPFLGSSLNFRATPSSFLAFSSAATI